LSASIRRTAIDLDRTEWLTPFFETWRFDSPDDLIAAIQATQVDLPTFSRSGELRDQGLGSWGYWFLFVKGWIEYRGAGELHVGNTYLEYMTEHFDARRHDPGIEVLMSDGEMACERVALRFRDMDTCWDARRERSLQLNPLEPVTVRLQDPLPFGAKYVYESGTSHAIGPAMIDGHHRLFAARLAGATSARAEVVAETPEARLLDLPGRIGETLRFTVPPSSSVALLTGPDKLSFGRLARDLFIFDPSQAATEDLVGEFLRRAEAEGWQFLLVPATELATLEDVPQLRDHLRAGYRCIAADPETCFLYALWREPEDAEPPEQGSAQAMPPIEMRKLSSGVERAGVFDEKGSATYRWLEEALARHSCKLESFDDVLDFGCGAGRVLRYLPELPGTLRGLDVNPYLVNWVRASLDFVEAAVSPALPPLDAPEGSWDLVLAIDVFTHLDEEHNRAWLSELGRVLRPNGLLVATYHGPSRRDELPPELRAEFDRGGMVVVNPALSGTNACAAYHSTHSVSATAPASLAVLEHMPDGAPELNQDVVLMARTGS
jgi:SAM-dependent methyltransferase